MNLKENEKYIYLVVSICFFFFGFYLETTISKRNHEKISSTQTNESNISKKVLENSKNIKNDDMQHRSKKFNIENETLDYFLLELKNSQYFEDIQNTLSLYIKSLDSKDDYVKKRQNKISEDILHLINSKKEWFKKEIQFDNSDGFKAVIFSKFERQSSERLLGREKSFERSHDVVLNIFYKINNFWEFEISPRNISIYHTYKNEHVVESRIDMDSKIKLKINLISLYVGVPPYNNVVSGLSFENKKFNWNDFQSTPWEPSSENEFKNFQNIVDEEMNK